VVGEGFLITCNHKLGLFWFSVLISQNFTCNNNNKFLQKKKEKKEKNEQLLALKKIDSEWYTIFMIS
jgi:hypothetical protein